MAKDDWREMVNSTTKMMQEKDEQQKSLVDGNQPKQNVAMIEPKNFGDVMQIIKHLKERTTVIFTLESLSHDAGQRILDYIAGATYALNGEMKRIDKRRFIATSGVII